MIDQSDPLAKLHTFDLFDTLIERPLKRPFHVFDLVEASGAVHYRLPGLAWLGFRRWRVLAERVARRVSGREDIGLAAIYRVLGWLVREPGRVMLRELRIELILLTPMADTAAGLRALLDQGHTCCVVTDMYLPLPVLRRLARRAAGRPVPVFASSDLGLTKRSGRLYRHVAAHYGVAFNEVEHVGDNPHSDGEVARGLGMRVRVLPARCVRDDSATPFEIFAPRGLEDSPLACLGYAVVGPVSMAFAQFVADQATRQKLTKVAFCARDTYLVKEAFDLLDTGVASRYLRVSRRALYVPAYARAGQAEYLFDGRLSGREFFARLGLEAPDELADLAPNAHRQRFLDALAQAGFQDRAEAEAAVLLDYLAAEGVSGDVGLVDLGWRGSVQDALQALLGERATLHGLYFGHLQAPGRRRGFYFADCRPLRRLARVFQALPVFEFLNTEPALSLERVRRAGGEFVFDTVADEPPGQVAARQEIACGCRRFMADFSRLSGILPARGAWVAPALDRLFDRYLVQPDPDVVAAFAGIGHAESFGGSMYADIVGHEPFTLRGYRNSYWRAAYARAARGWRGLVAGAVHGAMYSRLGMLLTYRWRGVGGRVARWLG